MEAKSIFNSYFPPSDLDFLPVKYRKIFEQFTLSFFEAARDKERAIAIIAQFIDLVREQIERPHEFAPYHKKVTEPADYFAFGNDFIRQLVDFDRSTLSGVKYFDECERYLKQGDNIVFLANHQIEADPQAISILLEKSHTLLSREMIFVAGERVLTDPLAVPFSLGRNLLCIYSKRYIDNPPEEKSRKQLHNKRTMELMSSLFSEGGHSIYVAPSGGRDRPNKEGIVQVAPFDPQSIEMFYLMARKAKKKTHFYPLALSTYAILPPPDTLQVELGEMRQTKLSPIHISCAAEFDMEKFPGSSESDRQVKRQNRALALWQKVNEDYQKFPRNA